MLRATPAVAAARSVGRGSGAAASVRNIAFALGDGATVGGEPLKALGAGLTPPTAKARLQLPMVSCRRPLAAGPTLPRAKRSCNRPW